MIPVALSYSQSLRVIGQALEVLRINTFTLEKRGGKYIVRNWEPSFLKSITERVWGPGDSDKILLNPRGPTEPLIYTRCRPHRSGRVKALRDEQRRCVHWSNSRTF